MKSLEFGKKFLKFSIFVTNFEKFLFCSKLSKISIFVKIVHFDNILEK